MIFLEYVGIALSQLWSHKLRSILTLLGMLIGVGSVVGIISISEGLRRTVIGEFGKLGGANLIWVWAEYGKNENGRWVPAKRYEPLTLEDADLVTGASPRIDMVLPWLSTGVEVRAGKASYQGQLNATIPPYTRAFNWDVEAGRFLRDRDLTDRSRVCVLGKTLEKKVFGGDRAIGREVKLNGQRYMVVGVMEDYKLFDNDWGYQVMVPVTTAQRRLFGNRNIYALWVYTRGPEDAPQVIPQVLKALRQKHGPDVRYGVETGKGVVEQIEKVILVMKLVTGGIAAISLLVGGIGIMNIMLVSVAERTREIGIRKAIGAKPGALRLQFIIEAVTLSLVGGVLGIGTGIGLGLGIARVIRHFAPDSPFTSVVSLNSIVMSIGIATAIGLFFGIYPAVRASRLNPVDALSSE